MGDFFQLVGRTFGDWTVKDGYYRWPEMLCDDNFHYDCWIPRTEGAELWLMLNAPPGSEWISL